MSLQRSDRHKEVIDLAEAISDDESQGLKVNPEKILKESEIGFSLLVSISNCEKK